MSRRFEYEPPSPSKGRGSWLSLFLVFILGTAAFVTLSFLTLGYFAPVLLIGGVIFAVAGFHYLVWGWWLGPVLQRQQEREEQRE